MAIINFLPRDTKLVNSTMHVNQSKVHVFVFEMTLFLELISKTFAYKIAWYHEVFQIITLPPRCKLALSKGYLESTASKRNCLCICFGDLERETGEDWHDKGEFSEKYIFFSLSACYNFKYLKIFILAKSLSKKKLVT